MKSIGEKLLLGVISCRVKVYFLYEEWKVRSRFYRNAQFRKRDRALKKAYRFLNPYRINKSFLKKKGHTDLDTYGETPLTSLYIIAQECGINAADHVIELGSGRGRGAFFLADVIGCQTTGVEWIPEFVSRAQALASDNPIFICGDMLQQDLSQATVIYLFGTCLPDETIELIISVFLKLKPSVKIITVSYPLSDYSSHFKMEKQFSVSFPWGIADVYLNSIFT